MTTWTHPTTGHPLAYDDRGSGPPVVLIHAYPFSRRMWDETAAALADVARVLTPDVFGFGDTPLPAAGWTVESMADMLADWLTGLGLDTAVVGGLSMGGYVALAFARRHGKRLRGLVLADTQAGADSPEAKANREKAIAFAEQNSAAAVIEQMIPKVLGESTRNSRPEVVAAVREMGAAQTVPGVVAALRALRDRPDSLPALASFRFPTLVIVGSEDTLTPPALAAAMEAKLPDVTAETLWASGHLSNLETPHEFTAAVRRWLGAIG